MCENVCDDKPQSDEPSDFITVVKLVLKIFSI